MEETTCDKCIHCTHITEDWYYYCEALEEYLSEPFALDPILECDIFEQKLDDNETQEP